jgi:hypothetical protein
MIHPDRAKQAENNPTHFANAQPPHHYRDFFNHQLTRLRIAQ